MTYLTACHILKLNPERPLAWNKNQAEVIYQTRAKGTPLKRSCAARFIINL